MIRPRDNTASVRRMGYRRALALVVLIGAGVGVGSRHALARPIPWKSSNFQYVADRKDLKDVLRDFGASENVMTWISPQVDGTVTGRFKQTPQNFLQLMSDSFGFVWYFDGSILRISGPNEARSATIGLTYASTEELRRSLERLGVADPRFPILYDDKTRTAVVSGPPRMVEMVTQIASLIDRGVERADEPQVRKFQLHFAWAMDRTLTINGQPVVVPGVASVLRGLYSDGAGANVGQPQHAARSDAYKMRGLDSTSAGAASASTGSVGKGLPTLPGLFGADSRKGGADMPPLPPAYQGDTGGAPPGLPLGFAAGQGEPGTSLSRETPVIEPDPRSNAILIRARAEDMPAFENLIASLDKRPSVIEIDASIIEISETGLKELGVDWRLHSSHVDIETGNGQAAQASASGSVNPQGFSNPNAATLPAVPATPAGGVMTAVIGGAGRYLLSRISALEQSDNARVMASPKVATLDNVEAVMDSKQTFYVPVQGYQSGDLYSVSAGVSLRVMPSLVADQAAPQIRLDVHIEDGQLKTQQVGQLPVVSNSTIETQTLIDEGQSLLIAGYSVDRDDRAETAVPGLSKVPLIGGLFRFTHQRGQRFQRLFLLTPHVVAAAASNDASPLNGNCATTACRLRSSRAE